MDTLHSVSEKLSQDDLNRLACDIVRFATEVVPQAEENFKSEEQLELVERLAESTHYKEQYTKRKLRPYLLLPQMVNLEYDNNVLATYSSLDLELLCRKWLLNKSLREKLKAEKTSKRQQTGVYTSQMDGWASDRLRGSLKIELFLDDAQLGPASGFGSGSGQKYIMVYATIADLPYHLRTKVEDIELLMMVKRSDLNSIPIEDRFPTLMSKLSEKLNKLSTEGIDINGEKFHATIASVLGDNLGVYEFLGFGTAFQTAAFTCRFCGMAGKPKAKSTAHKSELTCQDIKNINQIRSLITAEQFEQLDPEQQTEIGIRSGF